MKLHEPLRTVFLAMIAAVLISTTIIIDARDGDGLPRAPQAHWMQIDTSTP
jgi:hypothetical protein